MNTWLKLMVILMTVGGGFFGFATTVGYLAESSHHDPASLVIESVALGLYVFVIISGFIFVQNSKRLLPLKVALALQIPWISAPAFAYRFTAGLDAFFNIESFAPEPSAFKVGFDFRLGSRSQFSLSHHDPWGFGVNVVVVLFLILIWKAQRSNALMTSPDQAHKTPAQQEAVASGLHEFYEKGCQEKSSP